MTQVFCGIDPGLTGAVAYLSVDGKFIEILDTPTIKVKRGPKNRNLYLESYMSNILEKHRNANILTAIESVHAMPKQGVTSSFNFGVGLGIWLGILAALKIPYTRVEPAVWKKALGIAKGAGKSESIVRALQLHPSAAQALTRKKDEGRADALLIATYLYHQQRNIKL